MTWPTNVVKMLLLRFDDGSSREDAQIVVSPVDVALSREDRVMLVLSAAVAA